ncbi:TIGR00366 family protein [Brevibacillus humidisoli]|uniref:short-chain fatty acid transporter n=1 Tax=Brevibacillus humidisoli TaxID=2895522 RepID=UPI001E63D686|nr:TIGR00366 family protein [Brevibacillus humidisoli]UFJ39475.1 TIGR00366 family protein [Brevibacillus humidisoli]
MVRGFSHFFVRVMERYLPDPFLFATILTFVVFGTAWILTPSSPLQLVDYWAEGLWSLLVFTMQISIALVTGTALVRTKAVTKGLNFLSSLAKTPKAAYGLTALIAGVASLVSWAIGLVVGAFVARQMALRVKNVHYPLLVASAYSGFVIWHMGYSSSVALLIATEGHPLEQMIGIIPVSETMLAPFNVITALAILITLPFVMMRMAPKESDVVTIDASLLAKEETAASVAAVQKTVPTWASKIERLQIVNLLIGVAGLIYLIRHFSNGGSLDLNIVNLSFLVAGILLTKTPIEYIANVTEGGKSLGPIVLQFPFYGGIMGLMTSSGLAAIVAGWFVAISTAETLPFWSLICGGILNVFVPSGGGQWAVQGPIMMDAALRLGADLPRVAMGVAWGDQWTNMIQPFWALPALAIAGLKAKDIMGYCVITLIISGVFFSLGILFL